MRKFDILCNEKFNGDWKKTIDYIMKNITGEELRIYADEFNTSESVYASNVLYNIAKEEKGEEYITKKIKEETNLQFISLTREEVRNAEKNPYKATLGKSLLKLLIINGGIIALTTLMNNFDLGTAQNLIETVAIGGTSIYSSLTAMDIGVDLLKYFKFKKLKKQYNKEQQLIEEKKLEGKVL